MADKPLARDLTIWSFLMATAHGAGLMVLPFVLGDGSAGGAGAVAHQHVAHAAVASGLPAAGAGAALVHAAGYLLVTGLVAVVVYERVGLRMLRSAWINLDVIWAAALVATAVLTIML